jgi:hypothetical protein
MDVREMARKGGQSKSPAKVAAVRKNLEKARAARRASPAPRIPFISRYAETAPTTADSAAAGTLGAARS